MLKLKNNGSAGLLSFLYSMLSTMAMIDTVFSFFLLNFLTTYAKLPGGIAGSILLTSELVNVFIGPMASYLMDKFYVKSFGQHRFWCLLSLPFLIGTFHLIWFIPDSRYISLFTYYIIVLIAFNFSYGTLLVAFEGMIPKMFTDLSLLATLNSMRLSFASIASVLAVLFGAFLSKVPSNIRFHLMAASISILVTTTFLVFIFMTTESDDSHGEHGHDDQENSWFGNVKVLFGFKEFRMMLIFTCLVWIIITCVHSGIENYIDGYMHLHENSTALVSSGTLAILVVQLGTSVVQILMGVFPDSLTPELMVGYGLQLTVISSAYFAVFEAKATFASVLVTCFISGSGIGCLLTSFEIFIPQVVLVLEEQLHSESLENIVYGLADSTRELALAFSFMLVGHSSENAESASSVKLCSSYVPLLMSFCILIAFKVQPKIILVNNTPHEFDKDQKLSAEFHSHAIKDSKEFSIDCKA